MPSSSMPFHSRLPTPPHPLTLSLPLYSTNPWPRFSNCLVHINHHFHKPKFFPPFTTQHTLLSPIYPYSPIPQPDPPQYMTPTLQPLAIFLSIHQHKSSKPLIQPPHSFLLILRPLATPYLESSGRLSHNSS